MKFKKKIFQNMLDSIAGPRLIVMPWSILFSHWNSLAPALVAAMTTEEFRALI